jgi:hypothetical protein
MTHTKDEALKLALEALEPVSTFGRVGSKDVDTAKAQAAITAIKQALAAPTVQDPLITTESSLRFRLECEKETSEGYLEEIRELKGVISRMKAAAQPAVPLTDEQIDNLASVHFHSNRWPQVRQVARAIEATHGITKGQP